MTAILPVTTITTAVTGLVSPIMQLRNQGGQHLLPANVVVQGKLVYGSGGTSADAWVQTSFDGGGTWADVANFHFTTASATFLYNISSLTAVTTQYAPLDGTLAANTAKDGLIGSFWRVKYTTVGTYAGGTTLRVDLFGGGFQPSP